MTIKSKTHKGTGFNELRFEDKKGQEEVFIQAEKDYRRIVKNNEEVDIKNDLKINVAKSSEQEALSSLIEASDFIEFTVGSSTLKITPNGIELSSLNIDVDSSDLTLVEGGLVKINSGVSISGKGSTDVSDVKAAPDAEEFDGFGSNETLERVLAEKNVESVFKDVEPVQVAGLGKAVIGAIAADVVVKTAIYGEKIKNKLDSRKKESVTDKGDNVTIGKRTKIGNQTYTVDEKGRTIKAEGVIDGSHKGRKKKYVPEPQGGLNKGDHRGHLIPEGGIDDVKTVNVKSNVVSESPQSNLGLKKKFDLKASKIKDQHPNSKVTTEHSPQYKGNEARPHAVTHTLKKDDKVVESISILNPKNKK